MKTELLQTLRTICSNLRQLQTSAPAITAYREVEALLAREIARLQPATASRGRMPDGSQRAVTERA